MPVELRKRKTPSEPAPPPPAKKKSNPVKNALDKAKAVVSGKKDSTAPNGASSAKVPTTVGSVIDLEGFGGEIETNDGEKTTLKKLVEASKSGVVLFTYPKASTPGCTNQACMFRDDYTPLTATGLAIYGLSRDSPKANTTFKTKQKLPYPLLCDQSGTLIAAIGLKKAPSSTTRGVFVIDKSGKVLVSEPGGPGATVAAVKQLVESQGPPASAPPAGSAEATKVEPPAEAPAKMDIDSAPPATDIAVEPVKASEPAITKVSGEENTNAGAAPIVFNTDAAPTAAAPTTASTAAPSAAPTETKAPEPAPTANGVELTKEDSQKAEVAADVADTASKLDPATPNPA